MAQRYSMMFCGNSTSDIQNTNTNENVWPETVENIRQLINQRAKEKGPLHIICGTTPGTELASAWAAVKSKMDGANIRLVLAHTDKEEYLRLGKDEDTQFAPKVTQRLLTPNNEYVDAHIVMSNEKSHQDMMLRVAGAYATPEKPGVNETILVITDPAPSAEHPATQLYETAKKAGNIATELDCSTPEPEKQQTEEIQKEETPETTSEPETEATETIIIETDELAYRDEEPELYQDETYEDPTIEEETNIELPDKPVILVAKEGQWLATHAGKIAELGSIDPEFPYEFDIDLDQKIDKRTANMIQEMANQNLAKFETTNKENAIHVVLNPELIEGHLKTAGFDQKLGDPTRPEAAPTKTTELTAEDIAVPGANDASKQSNNNTKETDEIEQP